MGVICVFGSCSRTWRWTVGSPFAASPPAAARPPSSAGWWSRYPQSAAASSAQQAPCHSSASAAAAARRALQCSASASMALSAVLVPQTAKAAFDLPVRRPAQRPVFCLLLAWRAPARLASKSEGELAGVRARFDLRRALQALSHPAGRPLP